MSIGIVAAEVRSIFREMAVLAGIFLGKVRVLRCGVGQSAGQSHGASDRLNGSNGVTAAPLALPPSIDDSAIPHRLHRCHHGNFGARLGIREPGKPPAHTKAPAHRVGLGGRFGPSLPAPPQEAPVPPTASPSLCIAYVRDATRFLR